MPNNSDKPRGTRGKARGRWAEVGKRQGTEGSLKREDKKVRRLEVEKDKGQDDWKRQRSEIRGRRSEVGSRKGKSKRAESNAGG